MNNEDGEERVSENPSYMDYQGYWKPEDSLQGEAPRWAKYRTKMAGEFPSPYRSTKDPLARQVKVFVEKLDKLRPDENGPAYLGASGELAYTYPGIKNVEIRQEMGDLDTVLDEVVNLFHGAPNWGSPLTMCNVNPNSNMAAIMASMM